MNSSYKKVNDWFHTEDIDGYTPADTLQRIMDAFLYALKERNDTAIMRENELRKVMCDALCVMYHARLDLKPFSGPYRMFHRPAKWDIFLENAWNDYLHYFCYGMDFWEDFWHRIPTAMWEDSLPQWRHTFADIILLYIHPNIDNMVKARVLFEDDDGNITDHIDMDEE
jgi:hypothetical protein